LPTQSCANYIARRPRGREQEALQDRLAELAMTPLDPALLTLMLPWGE
jgi:hypothetical protein